MTTTDDQLFQSFSIRGKLFPCWMASEYAICCCLAAPGLSQRYELRCAIGWMLCLKKKIKESVAYSAKAAYFWDSPSLSPHKLQRYHSLKNPDCEVVTYRR